MKLQQTEALKPGADTWILCNRKNSLWARKVDWYLNFQISRSTLHEIPLLNSDQKTQLEWAEVDTFDQKYPNNGPLLLSSERQLPAKQIIRLSFSGDANTWLKSLSDIVMRLKSAKVRVFIPRQIDADIVERFFRKINLDVQIVEEMPIP